MADGVLAGRNALVTGGAQGLGAGMAQALAAAGAKVMIGDIQDASETASGIGGKSTALDVTDESSWEAAITTTIEQLGGLDILVNNAGIEISGLIVDLPPIPEAVSEASWMSPIITFAPAAARA